MRIPPSFQVGYPKMANFTDGRQLFEWVESKLTRLTDQAKDAIREGAKEGEDLTKLHIETRGTAKSGKQGRIETGRMRDAVSSRIEKDTDTEIEASFGWLDDRANYFGLQERGFTHTSGVDVEGMFALSDAADQVVRDIERKLGKAVKDV